MHTLHYLIYRTPCTFQGNIFNQGQYKLKEDNVQLEIQSRNRALAYSCCCKTAYYEEKMTVFLFQKLLVICQKMELAGKDQYVYDTKICLQVHFEPFQISIQI